VTNRLARSVSFKDRLIRRNVRVIDSWLLLSLPAGGGGAASFVAGGQHPVLCRPSWCHGEAGIRLQSPFTAPPTSPVSWITWGLRMVGDGARLFWIVLRSPCAVRPVNSCGICSDARNIGLFITATISVLPTCRHVITIEYKCIPR